MKPDIHSYVKILSYKHDGHIRRLWDQGFVLESDEEHFVVVTNKTWVRDDDGNHWFTREPAVCYFYTDRWYNVIAMLREQGIYYYCNLASPVVYDGEAIKYIDYDLDYKIFPDGTTVLLDEDEYRQHSEQMHYQPEIDGILKKYMAEIIQLSGQKKAPFSRSYNEEHFNMYLSELSQLEKNDQV